jgi:cysteine synthase
VTPMVRTKAGVFMKLEALQLGGSHKARAAKKVVEAVMERLPKTPPSNTTIIEKTGGNFGIGLTIYGRRAGFKVQLLIRPSFSPFRRMFVERLGAELFGQQDMARGKSNGDIISEKIAAEQNRGRSVVFADQFSNEACIDGHGEGARELAAQLFAAGVNAADPICLVLGVGTGASLVAYGRELRRQFHNVFVVLAEPAGCDLAAGHFEPHPFQGLAVGVVPDLYDPSVVNGRQIIEFEEAGAAAEQLLHQDRLLFGPSTNLVYAAALRMKQDFAVTVTIAYDGSEAYFADNLIARAAA